MGRFDRLTRSLTTRLSRRRGLAAGLAALAAGAFRAGSPPTDRADGAGAKGAGVGAATAAAGKSRPGRRRPRPEGPCGDGSHRANICTRDNQCCTGYCRRSLGKTNRDGKGRCRCVKPGGPCKSDRSCCGGVSCANFVCVPAAPAAACTVCASGCPFTSVNAAYAAAAPGATITIAPGAWTTGILVTKSATLAACEPAGGVTLQADPAILSPDGFAFVVSEDGVSSTRYTITLQNLDLRGNGLESGDGLLNSWVNGNVSFVVTGGSARDADTVFYVGGGDHVVTGMMTEPTVEYVFFANLPNTGAGSIVATGCQFQSRSQPFNVTGNGDPATRAATTFTLANCRFRSADKAAVSIGGGVSVLTGCTISDSENGCLFNDGDFTLADCTVSGNRSNENYGGVNVESKAYDTTLTITGTTVITDNNANRAGGIGVNTVGPGTVTVTGATTANVFDNTSPFQCGTYNGSWSDEPTCAF